MREEERGGGQESNFFACAGLKLGKYYFEGESPGESE